MEFLPDKGALFGRSPALEDLLDDLPDLSFRLFPDLLNTILFQLALSQREGSKIAILRVYFDFFLPVQKLCLTAFQSGF